jgi:hypothetical protein
MSRFYVVRNILTTLLKDMPLPLLLVSLRKIIRYQRDTLSVARREDLGSSVTCAWRSFLRAVPATLPKRREIQRQRMISTAEFSALLLSEYPLATRTPVRDWFKHRVNGPVRRFGGNLLEYVPEPIRPRIRDRDRQP